MSRPASTSATRSTPFQKVTARYEFKYDAYSAMRRRRRLRGSVEHGDQRRGRGLRVSAARLLAARECDRVSSGSTWTAWGRDELDSIRADQTYTKYDVGLSKDFTFATFHTIHLNGTYFGGQRLDRFSMYQFGLFDATRMHGVPSAVRFAELGMFRGSYSFNLFDQYRLDLFVDHADAGAMPQGDNVWRQVTGSASG